MTFDYPGKKSVQTFWVKKKMLVTNQYFLLFSLNTLPKGQNFRLVQIDSICRQKKINLTLILKFILRRVENIVGKGENAGYQHFLLFPQCFQKLSLSGLLKVGIVWYRVHASSLGNGESPF